MSYHPLFIPTYKLMTYTDNDGLFEQKIYQMYIKMIDKTAAKK